jgi:glutaredoxin
MTEETVVIYSNESQECDRMKSLLKTLGGEFHEYILGKHFTEHQFQSEFGRDATYPQVAIGREHIGSMKEALQFMKERGQFA